MAHTYTVEPMDQPPYALLLFPSCRSWASLPDLGSCSWWPPLSCSWSLLGSPVGVGFPWFLSFIGSYPECPLTSASGDAVGTGAAPTPSREVQGPSGPSGKKSHTELWGRKSPQQHAQSQRKQTPSENERGRTAGAGAWFPRTAGNLPMEGSGVSTFKKSL